MADFDLDILFLFKFSRGPGNQVLDVADSLADIIGKASSGIGCVGTALEGNDFKL